MRKSRTAFLVDAAQQRTVDREQPTPQFRVERENVSFWLTVKPRSTRQRLSTNATGELRLELHAPPTEGRANEACVQFLARALRLPQACVVILSGAKSRRKHVRITGHSAGETIARLKALAGRRSAREAS